MKMKHYTYITLFSLLTIAASSCKDNDKKDITPEPLKITFTDKKWKTETWDLVKPLDLDEDGDKETDLMQLLIECDLDDFIVFQKDGKFITNTGSKRCNAKEEQENYTANWAYDEAAKIIKMKSVPSGLEKDDWEVLELTETTLKVRFNLLPEDGESAAIKSVMTLKTM
ncbi:lipocalin family protein [Dyadobacter jiangsuensis]|uniref:Lipocalin-like protein n=1 Tax=Dyadobacter jiangsuensis TaxID=1591085 RepID=A0A2P8FMG8_9BACT|nr:lipocalin family protein [Dyadobacter jiangsuensis]PSL22930.1 lipocalin-like protein [Dyadobacter jiangsuensis]